MFVLTPTQRGSIASSPVFLPLTCYNTTATATTTTTAAKTTAAAATTVTTSNDKGNMDNNGNDNDKAVDNARITRVMYKSEGR